MSRRERLAWWVVCAVPRFIAKWLMFGKGQKIRLPKSWFPYLFGRALGVDGSKAKPVAVPVPELPVARTERPSAQAERIAG